MSRVLSSAGLVLAVALAGTFPGCATTSRPPVASAVGEAVDLSGDWTANMDMVLAEGVSMYIRGTHQLARTSADNYAKEGSYALSFSFGADVLPFGRLTFTSTVKSDRREECETFASVSYERPESMATEAVEAAGLPAEQYEGMLKELADTATVEEFNKDSNCDKVLSSSRDEVVVEDKDGNKMTYQRTR